MRLVKLCVKFCNVCLERDGIEGLNFFRYSMIVRIFVKFSIGGEGGVIKKKIWKSY